MGNYKFFQNKACEYFPCHETKDKDTFNCLFCYCPLYALGDKSGGGFEYTASGIKSCMKCTKTHGPNGYDYVMEKMKDVMALAKKEERVEE